MRAAAEARGLLGGTLESAHVPPPETVEEFVAASRGVLRAVFGPFEMDVYRSRLDGEVGPIEPTLVRFNLSPAFFRAVAKVGFHYFLWACPQIGGDEPEFSGIRSQAVGPPFPTFVVRLGKRPESLAKEWRRVHVAAYSPDFAGHDGFLKEL